MLCPTLLCKIGRKGRSKAFSTGKEREEWNMLLSPQNGGQTPEGARDYRLLKTEQNSRLL